MSNPVKTERYIDIKSVTSFMFRYMWKYPVYFVVCILSTITFSAISILLPLYYKKIVDTIVWANGNITDEIWQVLITVLFTIAAIAAVSWTLRRVSHILLSVFQSRSMRDISNHSFSYLIDHSHKYFADSFIGSLVRKVNRGVRAYEVVLDSIVFNIIPLTVSLIGIVIVLGHRHAYLAIALTVWLVMFFLVRLIVAKRIHKHNIARAAKDSEAGGKLADALGNHANIKLFASGDRERNRFGSVMQEVHSLRLKVWLLNEAIDGIQGVFLIALEIGLLFLALLLWRQDLLTVGDFALLQSYIVIIIGHLWSIGGIVRRWYEAYADATEIVEVLELEHGVSDKLNASTLSVTKGDVELKEVDFGYRSTRMILKNFNEKIKAGEKVALVGPSGAGKSTIIQALLRLYDVQRGAVMIDGQKVVDVTQSSLRQAIGYVPQDSILFHRTLLENIRYGRPNATDEEVMEAAKKAHCHEFIDEFPDKYNTYVGERGVKLSGGERQRVAIARAFLKNAPILILDEATSSLDSQSEKYIQEALHELMEGKTVIVIAHRLSTVMEMDRILVLQDGKVIDSGSHDELLQKEGGLYKKLWDIQAGGFIA